MIFSRNRLAIYLIFIASLLLSNCNHREKFLCSGHSNEILLADLIDSLNLYARYDSFNYMFELNEPDSVKIYCEKWFYILQLKDLDRESISYFKHKNNSSYIVTIKTVDSQDLIFVRTKRAQITEDHLTFEISKLSDTKKVMSSFCQLIWLSKE